MLLGKKKKEKRKKRHYKGWLEFSIWSGGVPQH